MIAGFIGVGWLFNCIQRIYDDVAALDKWCYFGGYPALKVYWNVMGSKYVLYILVYTQVEYRLLAYIESLRLYRLTTYSI